MAESLMHSRKEYRIAVPFGQAQEVMAQMARPLQGALATIELRQPPHGREQMAWIVYLSAQLQRAGVCGPDLRRSEALRSDERFA
jgi:hypothetical protein